MDQRIIDLYDEYTHAPLPRRVFLERLALLAGGAAAVPAILAQIEPNYALAAVVPADDPRLLATRATYPGAGGDVAGYFVRPKIVDTAPAVIVIHENRGLNPHIEDVTRRLAVEGFVAFAPDLLSPAGGTPQDPDRAREMIGKLDREQTVSNLAAAISFLTANRYTTGKVGAVGFCWGGGMVNQLALRAADLKAGVAYYGRTPEPAQVTGPIKAPLLLHYAGQDQGINAGIPAYEEALKKVGASYMVHMYEGAQHAFNNDTSAERYNEAAAKVAWQRTVEFLKRGLA